MGFIKKIVHFLAILSYILIIIYALICGPILVGYYPLVILTGSMEPSFKTGSVIYYQKVQESELKVGDAITFYTVDNEIVTHRIVSINDGLFETKGDANNVSDLNKVRYSDILGRDLNISIIYIGFFINFINNYLIYSISAVVLILLLEFLFSNFDFIK